MIPLNCVSLLHVEKRGPTPTHATVPTPGNEVNSMMYVMGTAHSIARATRPYGFSRAMRAHCWISGGHRY